MRPFGSLADGVLADTILIPLSPPILPTNLKKVHCKNKWVIATHSFGLDQNTCNSDNPLPELE